MYTSNGNTFIIDPIFLQQLEPLPPPSSLFSSSHHILPPPPSSSFSSTLMFPSNNDHDHSSNNDKKKKKKEEGGERCVWKKNNSTSTSSGTTGTGTGGGGRGGGGGNTKHKTDRHSKIRTAKGLRDRRMRLSLDVARRFFGLQDMLGFDKASKTVEWLLSQAKSQIHNLEMTLHYNSGWSTSSTTSSTTSTTTTATMNCSSLSGLDDVAADPSSTMARRVKVSRRARVQRESRAKARERARERTREKMMMRRRKLITTITSADDDDDGGGDNGGGGGRSKQIPQNINIVKNNMNPPPSSNCFDVGEILESESDQQARDDQKNLWSVLLEDDDVVPMINKWSWSPSMYFNSLHTSGLLIHEQFSSESFQSMGGLLYDI